MTKYTISYRYNDKTVTLGPYEFLTIAQLEMIKLEAYGLTASLHEINREESSRFVGVRFGV